MRCVSIAAETPSPFRGSSIPHTHGSSVVYNVDTAMKTLAYLVRLRHRTLSMMFTFHQTLHGSEMLPLGLPDHSKVDTRARAQTSIAVVATTSSFCFNPLSPAPHNQPMKPNGTRDRS